MQLISNKIYIRFLDETDAEAQCTLNLQNKDFFRKYSPIVEDNYYTLAWQRETLGKCKNQREKDIAFAFGIFMKDTKQLIGNISLYSIGRGPIQRCMVGYSLDKQSNGKGYMTEAIKLVVGFAFNELLLHRIEAGVMPHNIGSITALEKAGFSKEGLAKSNVKINGKWEDHQMFAIISDND